MVEPERIRALNSGSARRGRYVLYWMQASQRAEYNHALEYAIGAANDLAQPVVVFFGLTNRFPEGNLRHYRFMLEGMKHVKAALNDRGIALVVAHGAPDVGAVRMSRDASVAVVDRGYLRVQRLWRDRAAGVMACPLIQVESDVVVPVEEASGKEEYAAATIRPKIHRKLRQYLRPLRHTRPRKDSLGLALDSFGIDDADAALSRLKINRGVAPVASFLGGTDQAKRHLRVFLGTKIARFAELRNDPSADCLSNLSPYLHFGQISPLYIALEARKTGRVADSFLEELIVRRELSVNYVFYNQHYDTFAGLPAWAIRTLARHRQDARPYAYTRETLENAATHDRAWNAAQTEMLLSGKMHGYMRMYWGKKIIEWTPTPEAAFTTALYLNNKYELDGRDPNGFAGVAWCFGKHDRPWGERKIFGSVRYMGESGLRRKFDVDAYAERVDSLARLGNRMGARGRQPRKVT